MTGKRFEINNNMNFDSKVETYELSCIVDNENKTFYFVVDSIANVDLFVERLNNLADENEQLKETNQKLYDELQETMSHYSLKMGEVSILKRKNEQLKKSIKEGKYHD